MKYIFTISILFLISCNTNQPREINGNKLDSNKNKVQNNTSMTSNDTLSEFPASIISFGKPLGSNQNNILGQSPIDINSTTTKKFHSTDPLIHYQNIVLSSIQHTEENLKINLSAVDQNNNYITIKGVVYKLIQFHFHDSSETTINGKRSLMEVHFVNMAADSSFTVLALLIEKGSSNPLLEKLINASPLSQKTGIKQNGINAINDSINLNKLLPTNTVDYYTFSGSLTTPNLDTVPNKGPVTFIVFKSTQQISNDVYKKYIHIYEKPNYRVIQKLGSRIVYENVQ